MLSRLLRPRTPAHLANVVRPRHHRMACVVYTVCPHTGQAQVELAARRGGDVIRFPGCSTTFNSERMAAGIMWDVGLIPVRADRVQTMQPTLEGMV